MKHATAIAAGWMLVCLVISVTSLAAEPEVIFEDKFEGKLGDGWTWLRENTDTWRIKDGGLEIMVQPGVAHDVKNALLREVPDRAKGKYAFEVTVTSHTVPTQQYEQAGITWYHKDRPCFKIVKELINGGLFIIPGKKPMDAKTVQLRVIVDGQKLTAQYRPNAEGEFKPAGTKNLPPPGDDKVSIQCYNGPKEGEHWIRFDDFRILKMP